MKRNDKSLNSAEIAKLGILQRQFEDAAKDFPAMMHVMAQRYKDGMNPIVPPAWKNSKPQRSKDGMYPIVPDGLDSSDCCPRVWGGNIRRKPDERGYPTVHWLRCSFHQGWDMQAALERFDTLAGETGEIVAKADASVLPISKAELWVKQPQEYWVLLLHHFKQKQHWTLVNVPGEILIPKLLHGLVGTRTVNVRVKTLLGGTTETRLALKGESYVCWFDDVFLASALALGELLSKKPQPAHTKEQPWADDAPEYLPLTEASKLIDGRLKMPALSKLCKPDGEMRYMRKPGSGCKVHLADFRRYMQGRQSDPKWAKMLAVYYTAAGKGDSRLFWRCKQCGHEYPETSKANPDSCPNCKGKSDLITKAPPKPRR